MGPWFSFEHSCLSTLYNAQSMVNIPILFKKSKGTGGTYTHIQGHRFQPVPFLAVAGIWAAQQQISYFK